MHPQLPPPSTLPMRGNFVLLMAGSLQLLLSQAEVGTATYLDSKPERTEEPGIFRTVQSSEKLVALSASMKLLEDFPEDRFVTCRIQDETDFSWCWSGIKVLIDVTLHPIPIPPVLVGTRTPARRYVELEGQFVWLCEAAHVASFALQVNC